MMSTTLVTSLSRSTPNMSALLLLILSLSSVAALISNQPVAKLLQTHASDIQTLRQETEKLVSDTSIEPYNNDVFYLRYCLADSSMDEKMDLLRKNLNWRQGEGAALCRAALQGYLDAKSEGGWKNDAVLKQAPHSALVSKYLTPENCLTTTSSQDDLVYCVRAGLIDDVGLMSQISIDELSDFFVYVKEVHALVSNQRSCDLDKLVTVITANDLSGVKLVGGSADFRKALGAKSGLTSELYPSTAGPTLLLNLPALLNALVKLFTPLFPPAVNERLKFTRGVLKDNAALSEIRLGGSKRAEFLKDLDSVVYGG